MVRSEEFGREPIPVRDARGVGDIFPFEYFRQPLDILIAFRFKLIDVLSSAVRVRFACFRPGREASRKGIGVKKRSVNEFFLKPAIQSGLLHHGFPVDDRSKALTTHHFRSHQEDGEERSTEYEGDEKARKNQDEEVHDLREILNHLIDLFFIHRGEKA